MSTLKLSKILGGAKNMLDNIGTSNGLIVEKRSEILVLLCVLGCATYLTAIEIVSSEWWCWLASAIITFITGSRTGLKIKKLNTVLNIKKLEK